MRVFVAKCCEDIYGVFSSLEKAVASKIGDISILEIELDEYKPDKWGEVTVIAIYDSEGIKWQENGERVPICVNR